MLSDKSETHSELLVEIDKAVAVVTINRPKVLNALNGRIIDALGRTMHRLKSDETVRTVVITGAGDRAFVAGAGINRWGSPLLPLLTVSHWVEAVN